MSKVVVDTTSLVAAAEKHGGISELVSTVVNQTAPALKEALADNTEVNFSPDTNEAVPSDMVDRIVQQRLRDAREA